MNLRTSGVSKHPNVNGLRISKAFWSGAWLNPMENSLLALCCSEYFLHLFLNSFKITFNCCCIDAKPEDTCFNEFIVVYLHHIIFNLFLENIHKKFLSNCVESGFFENSHKTRRRTHPEFGMCCSIWQGLEFEIRSLWPHLGLPYRGSPGKELGSCWGTKK